MVWLHPTGLARSDGGVRATPHASQRLSDGDPGI